MNERIKELRIQACKWACENATTSEYENACDAKFAELIVKECVKVAKATPCAIEDNMISKNVYGHTWDMACIYTGKEIEKHFGVE